MAYLMDNVFVEELLTLVNRRSTEYFHPFDERTL
tara:strand:- start:131 stop:232 length:102 start_codon:yes stop_codon:yes gene_type:complete